VKPIATQQRIPMGGYVLFATQQSGILLFNSPTHQPTNPPTHKLKNL